MEEYGQGSQASRAGVADKVELIQMLFDGLIESMVTAQGHIERGAIEEKNKSLTRAGRHHHWLAVRPGHGQGRRAGPSTCTNCMDMSPVKLIHVNAYNDVAALKEILSLIREISQAWKDVPTLLPGSKLGSRPALSVVH